jgi:Glycosyl hydrolase family 115/Gylcosyl hydrolase family 115 C-terminal domain
MRSRLRRLTVSLVATVLVPVVHAAPAASAPDNGARAGAVAHESTYDAAPGHGHGGRGDEDASYIATHPGRGRFPLVARGAAAPIVVSGDDHPGVVRVVGDLQTDIGKVTGVTPAVLTDAVPRRDAVVIVGTIGRSPLIDGLVASGKLDVRAIAGRWETSLEQVVERPMPGVRRAFVIAGSDQRGTIYGAYDVSEKIGVSPWYWWDDVPVERHDALYVLPGAHSQGTPAVRYRGFFINDENPNLGTWGPEFFGPGLAPGHPGGFNHRLYEKVFETLLRLKANYLWPAVWGRAFAEDDPQNHATASRYGVIMGTSHEAPMMRGIEEWNRHATGGTDPYGGTGEWSFVRNRAAIEAYWRDGIERMVDEDIEGVVTLGMRGPGDVGLPDGEGIELMQDIIGTQRRILGEVTGRPVTEIPQVWTLYKEVQRYWERGMTAPDDVTVVFTDDNWGNMMKLPDQSLPPRGGGYGMYYHFDYVGDGRNYKWVDTAQLPNTWQQLSQSYAYGVDRLWVANVGDMKNEELPLQFFLDYAWDPSSLPLDAIDDWERDYAAQSFGDRYADDIAEVLHDYSLLQSDRKPELLNRKISLDPTKDLPTDESAVVYDDEANPFSLTNYAEHERVTDQWQQLAARAERIGARLPEEYQDAYFQLVGYATLASANLYELREAEFTNIHYANQGRAATNRLADEAEARFAEDLALMDHYNTAIAGGKWHNWMLQPHIDYGDVARYGPNAPWQQPELNNVAIPDVIFPALQRIEVPQAAEMGVAIDGSEAFWTDASAPGADPAVLPTFSPYQSQPRQYIEVFNRGRDDFGYTITAGEPWVRVSPRRGTIDTQARVEVSVDWRRAPVGTTTVPITVTGSEGSSIEVRGVVDNAGWTRREVAGFVEANGYVSIEADHYSRAVNGNGVRWREIPDIGRTGDGMIPTPVTAVSQTPGGNSPRLEYTMTLSTTGPVDVTAYLSPRNNVLYGDGIRYAVSIDDAPPQVVNITTATGANPVILNRQWERNTSDNVSRTTTTHVIDEPGVHTLRFWMVDPTVILQNLVVDTGDVRDSYLGPPESFRAR